ncbi:MAG: hypothetical protein PHV75_09105, partial [Victivallaceae bacterium]|nr:hypothetical protein [Victivallaceae bacterium]
HNSIPDYNPYLGLHGEGDKASLRMTWLKKLMADMIATDPSFCVLIEGVGDVFSSYTYSLLSGFKRDANILRYTLPDQIYFLGQQNLLQAKPLSKRSLSHAFLYGMKFDIAQYHPHTYYILRLRQKISPLLNYAVFNDTIGLGIDNSNIKAYSHVIMPDTKKFIDHTGTKAITITFLNENKEKGKVEYELPEGFSMKYGFVFQLYTNGIEDLKYTIRDKTLIFDAPLAESSAVILVDKVTGAQEWTAIPKQVGLDKVEVELYNFNDVPLKLTLEATSQFATFLKIRQTVTVPPKSNAFVAFNDEKPSETFRMANITVKSESFSRTYVISLGKTGRSVPAIPENH